MARVYGLIAAATLALVLVSAGVPGAAGDPPSPEDHTVWFGPDLDWQNDSAEAYAQRFGVDASLFGRSVEYPLNSTSDLQLRDLSRQSARAGSVAVVTLQPADLVRLSEQDAADFAAAAATATTQDGSFLLVRFAPEMNGSWTSWGRRPVTYVKTFRALADALHDATTAAVMVWSPAYGAGYPFTAAINSTTSSADAAPAFDKRNVPYLDTDNDGVVTSADDPYGPYYPGDDYVDWVGLTMLRYGVQPFFGANTLPEPGELEARFEEDFGYGDDAKRASFYLRFADSVQQPFLLATGAMYNPRRRGASEIAIKQAWLRQIVGAVASRPMLRAVQWLEQSRAEPEAGGTVNWQITDDPAMASVSRAVLEQGAVTFGPLDGVGDGPDPPTAATSEPSETATPAVGSPRGGALFPFLTGALAMLVFVLVAAVVAVRVRRRRTVPPWLR